jgi:hypothetical protein
MAPGTTLKAHSIIIQSAVVGSPYWRLTIWLIRCSFGAAPAPDLTSKQLPPAFAGGFFYASATL